jgi:hypothetical protein
VLPLPHKNAIGGTPPEEFAVHAILPVDGTPAHEAVSVAALANVNESANSALAIEAINIFIFITECVLFCNAK